MSSNPEVIVAVASGTGTSAVSLIRLSGSGVIGVVDRCCSIDVAGAAECSPREQRMCRILADDGSVTDEVLLTVFPGPRSYTGEDVIEIGCHGGRLITRKVVERMIACGARPACAGEFTERAFVNGKM
ncbi:MAG: tRNA uridine-5-carboxymethylaminomethyl(34) synthesis GTPase MnmE, partial [Verrucomicrobiales bacterium]|nr:tRNA uridine-5-carboxymethylaminomethyl(34) synthesis GTPase MnmE [Verrucomicrobiales bacterium]